MTISFFLFFPCHLGFYKQQLKAPQMHKVDITQKALKLQTYKDFEENFD